MKLWWKLLLPLCVLPGPCCYAQSGTWVWVNGSDSVCPGGVYGTKGVPSVSNSPPGLYAAANWIDQQGNFWVFGGIDSFLSEEWTRSDMWMYNPQNNTWTWMNGPGIEGQAGINGTKGIPAPANYPGSRGWGFPSWADTSGNLWLYGGDGVDGSGNLAELNDLWRYNINTNEWTWMSGNDTAPLPDLAVYGVYQVPADSNTPGSRWESTSTWTDKNNKLWLFGGGGGSGANNDMWIFDIGINEWVWMEGSQNGSGPGSYGTLGVESSTNLPPSRWTNIRWEDAIGNFYIYGGDATGAADDVWKFNPLTNNWTWVAGFSTPDDAGNYGAYCDTAYLSRPAGRVEARGTVSRGCSSNFYSFGGASGSFYCYDDLWAFNPQNNKWTFLSGDNSIGSPGNLGTRGVASPANQHPASAGPCVWTDSNGVLWVFGGAISYFNPTNITNSIWKFIPDSSCLPLDVGSGIKYTLSSTAVCPGDTVFLHLVSNVDSISPQVGVTWLDSANAILILQQSGSYTVYGTSACGTNDSSAFTINVLNANVSVSANKTIMCPGDSARLCAPEGYTSYVWNDGQTAACIYVSQAGNYYATITDGTNCTAQSNPIAITVLPSPSVSITVNGDTLTVYGNYSFQWYEGGQLIAGATAPMFIANTPGSFTVAVTDGNGCSSVSNPVIINGIDDLTQEAISIYPNPTNSKWQITVSNNLIGALVEIWNNEGQAIYKTKITSIQSEINLSAVAGGVYFLRVNSTTGVLVRKLVKL